MEADDCINMPEIQGNEACDGESAFLHLPPEVLENIFVQSSLQASDLRCIACTCSSFTQVLQSNELWRKKFQQRWPSLYQHIHKDLRGACGRWKRLFYQRFVTRTSVLNKIERMLDQTYTGEAKALVALSEGRFYNLLDSENFPSDANEDFKYRYDFVMSELKYIVTTDNHTLTQQYFADKVMWYLHHETVQSQLHYLNVTAEAENRELDIELGVFLLAKWFQPLSTFTFADIKSQLDDLALEAKEKLFEQHSSHPFFTNLNGQLIEGYLQKSLWSSRHCRQVIDAIAMIFRRLFNQNFQEYYKEANSYINKVLEDKQGIPITLCIVVQAVAKRLGVKLEPVNFPSHFLLRWPEHDLETGLKRFTFIDPFNAQYNASFEDVQTSLADYPNGISEQEVRTCNTRVVLGRMARNLIAVGKDTATSNSMHLLRAAAEFYLALSPNDEEVIMLNVQIKLHFRIDLLMAISKLQDLRALRPEMANQFEGLQNECEGVLARQKDLAASQSRKAPKIRSHCPEVRFSVGMVMRHKKYNYLCVINGWDKTCEGSIQWIQQMGVHKLDRGSYQPFYKVFVADGTDRYAAEENLEMTRDIESVTHSEVGRVFERFTGRYYVPNRMTEAFYPEDGEATHRIVTEFFEGKDSESSSSCDHGKPAATDMQEDSAS